MATVKMVRQISGSRDGKDWPKPGETIDVPADEAKQLIANGNAVDPSAGREEKAVVKPDVETAVRNRAHKAVNANKDRKEG